MKSYLGVIKQITPMIGFNKKEIGRTIYLSIVIFLTYTCVFAFRKPFSVATFQGIQIGPLTYQTSLIICQVIGYMISKFIGISFISGLDRSKRYKVTIRIMGISWLSLLLFAIVPPVIGLFCMMLNGFMLGFMWGIIFSYAEGRRATDFIGSVLAVSFIFAGGFTRSVGKYLIQEIQVQEKWMPFVTGLIFVFPLLIFFHLLNVIAPPDELDKVERVERIQMQSADRKKILKNYGWGLMALSVIYMLLTIARDIRDNYMGNMWRELGFDQNISILTSTETKITLVVLFIMAMLVFIRKNITAFMFMHGIILLGFFISGVASYFFIQGLLPGNWWMLCVGLGLYMSYIPFNALFFDRMIAAFKIAGNVGFLIYLTDAFGYLGSVTVMLTKELIKMEVTWTVFYSNAVMIFSIIGIIGTIYSFIYFKGKYRRSGIY